MKIIFIMTLVLLVSACGKNGSSSDPSVEEQNGYVDVSSSASSSSDLMNVTVDVPVMISGDRIQFLRGASPFDPGLRKTCSFQVSANDVWHFHLAGNRLIIDRSDGSKLTFTKLRNTGFDAHGIWAWSGHTNGMKVIRRLYLLDGRFILNQDCEG